MSLDVRPFVRQIHGRDPNAMSLNQHAIVNVALGCRVKQHTFGDTVCLRKKIVAPKIRWKNASSWRYWVPPCRNPKVDDLSARSRCDSSRVACGPVCCECRLDEQGEGECNREAYKPPTRLPAEGEFELMADRLVRARSKLLFAQR